MNGSIDFAARPRRSRAESWVLDATAPSLQQAWRERLTSDIGAMGPTVVEIGAGTGANMGFYRPGVKVIAIEPNPHMHPALRARAEKHGVDLEIRELRGEQLDLPDASVDGVVATLVLCGVDDATRVVEEIVRVLKPGGTYFFLEHVVAPEPTWTRRVQRLVKRPHRWMFNGCEVDRDTTAVLRHSGFASVDLTERDAGPKAAYVRHQIGGVATR